MTIQQLKEMPIGSKTGSFYLTIKTAKKKWQDKNGDWICQVLLADKTGEMLADVCIGENIPLQRTQALWVVVCEVQEAEPDQTKASRIGKKLLVSEFRLDEITEPPEMGMLLGEGEKVIRGKVLCWMTAAKIQTGATAEEVKAFITEPAFKEIVDIIMDGGQKK